MLENQSPQDLHDVCCKGDPSKAGQARCIGVLWYRHDTGCCPGSPDILSCSRLRLKMTFRETFMFTHSTRTKTS
ncbi:hypothetical protein ATANTOWER_025448 [Ataeniobius toweri]|uniref:Uncharacterized protein n=1 Tax=Ataeniobius toweri TaxID=208326 RepID=A0ABU7BTH6_9TELE|nr:hypothetical protein [Ataeniobius toweri]